MQGSLYRNWPENKEIFLLECLFKQGEGDRDFIIQTKIKADNEEQARIFGRKNCHDAVNFLEFCIGEQVDLDRNKEEISKKGDDTKHGLVAFRIIGTIISNSPLTKEQLIEIDKAQNNIMNTGTEDQLILIKSIHWWALGKRESDNIDRFIKLWIALEILVEGKGDKLVKKVKKKLIKLYPSYDEEKIRQLVGRVYGMRGDIIHKGFREPLEVIKHVQHLEATLEDLLSLRLKMKFKELTEEYLNSSG